MIRLNLHQECQNCNDFSVEVDKNSIEFFADCESKGVCNDYVIGCSHSSVCKKISDSIVGECHPVSLPHYQPDPLKTYKEN